MASAADAHDHRGAPGTLAPEVEGDPDGTEHPAVPTTAGEEGGAPAPAAVLRIMSVLDVVVDLPDPFAVIQLIEDEPPGRRLDIPVGTQDAVTLAYALRGRETPRPLTHELFADVLRRYQIDVVAMRLTGRSGGVYLAEIDLMGPKGREVLACRPSDGITLCLRHPVAAPVLADERLLASGADVEAR